MGRFRAGEGRGGGARETCDDLVSSQRVHSSWTFSLGSRTGMQNSSPHSADSDAAAAEVFQKASLRTPGNGGRVAAVVQAVLLNLTRCIL